VSHHHLIYQRDSLACLVLFFCSRCSQLHGEHSNQKYFVALPKLSQEDFGVEDMGWLFSRMEVLAVRSRPFQSHASLEVPFLVESRLLSSDFTGGLWMLLKVFFAFKNRNYYPRCKLLQ